MSPLAKCALAVRYDNRERIDLLGIIDTYGIYTVKRPKPRHTQTPTPVYIQPHLSPIVMGTF